MPPPHLRGLPPLFCFPADYYQTTFVTLLFFNYFRSTKCKYCTDHVTQLFKAPSSMPLIFLCPCHVKSWPCLKIIARQCRTNLWPAVPDWPWCRTNFFSAFRHLLMIFQHHVVRIFPSAAVYGRAGCTTFHYLQFRRVDIPFSTTNTSRWTCWVYVSLFTAFLSLTNWLTVYKSSSFSVDVQVQGVCINFHLCKVSFKCQNAGISGIMSIWYQNEQNADAGTSPLLE